MVAVRWVDLGGKVSYCKARVAPVASSMDVVEGVGVVGWNIEVGEGFFEIWRS